MYRPAFKEFAQLADSSGPEDAGLVLFCAYYLKTLQDALVERRALEYCQKHIDVDDSRQLLDCALALAALHALPSIRFPNGFSAVALSQKVDLAIKLRINLRALFNLDQLDSDEFLCHAITWLFVFERARLTALDPFKERIAQRVKQRRQKEYRLLTGDGWRWQARLVTTIMYSLCDWGNKSLMDDCVREGEYIRANMATAVELKDVAVVGDFVLCLARHDYTVVSLPFFKQAQQLLREHVIAENERFFDRFHTAWCRAMGLRVDH